MFKLVLLRHGQSQWNLENKFTGWTDVPLSPKGIEEARKAGRILKQHNYSFDIAYTSVLKRAIHTLWLALEEMDQFWIPVKKSWRLNERHYGDLQGLNKAETAQKHSEEQVHIWRRSFATRPPLLKDGDERLPEYEEKYKLFDKNVLPRGESLKDTIDRFIPYWQDVIKPDVLAGKNVLISAHGNSLRALVMHLDKISSKDISNINIPTGIPLVYELEDSSLKPLRSHYLADEEELKREMEKVALQGKSS